MSEMEEIQPQEVSESTDAPAAEEQTLADATYEADAHVDQSGNYEESEAVETAMTDVIDSIVEEPAQESVEAPRITKEVDPVTGQSKPGDSSGSEESGAEEQPSLVVEEDQSEIEAPAGSAVDESEEQPGVDMEGEIASDAAEARREGEEYGDDGNTAIVTDDGEESGIANVEKPAGLVEDEGVDAGQIDEPLIERQLPQEEILAAGMDKQGLMPGKAGAAQEGYPGFGKGTSGGGPGVTGKSGKSVDVMVPGESKTGHYLDIESMKNDGGVVVDADGEGYWEKQDNGNWHYVEYEHDDEDPPDAGTPPEPGGVYGLTPDGDTPMPYTGSTYGGEPTDLSHKPPAGPDECGFLQMIAGGKMDAKSYYGYGSTGSATFTPSGDSDEHDSGHFYGGLSGSDPNKPPSPDPGDLDYYTPNELAEALAKAQEK